MRNISVEFERRHFPFPLSWNAKEDIPTGAEDKLSLCRDQRQEELFLQFVLLGTSNSAP